MAEIETGITINVYADPEYGYAVNVAEDELSIAYTDSKGNVDGTAITFGSKAEMEAVALAMLKACKI
jgi:hypothetical protein